MKHAQLAVALAVIAMMTVLAAPAVSAEKSVDLTATVLEPKPQIAIELSTNALNFGDLYPGNTSDPQSLTVTNIGLKQIDVTATASDDGAEPLFTAGLLIDNAAYGDYSATLAADELDDANLALHVPDAFIGRGAVSGGATFWAEEHITPVGLSTIYQDPVGDALSSIDMTNIRMGTTAKDLIVEVDAPQSANEVMLFFDTDRNADTGSNEWKHTYGVSGVMGAELSFCCNNDGSCTGWGYYTDEGGTHGWQVDADASSCQNSTYRVEIPLSLIGTTEFNLCAYSETDDGMSGWYDFAPNYGVIYCSLLASAPSADFSADMTSGIVPLAVQFTDLSTNSPTAWSWDFNGDGIVDSIEQNPIYEYSSPGTYTVTLTASNLAGTGTEIKAGYIVMVLPTEAPVADFSASPTSGLAPLSVHFTDLSTNSPTSWAWDFDNDGVIDSTVKNPVWAYEASGSYSVKLAVSNIIGSDDLVKEYYIDVSSGESWTVFHGNQQLTGYSGYDAPDTNSSLWISDTIGASKSSSVVIGEGKMFVYCLTGGMGYGDPQGYIAALDLSTGELLWKMPTVINNPYGSWATPAYADGLVFTPGDVARYASNGTPAWPSGRYLPDNTNGGPLVVNGKVYCGNWDGNTYFCFGEMTGEQLWSLPVNGYAQGTPAYHQGKLFLTSWAYGGNPAGTLYCVNVNSGAIIWTATSSSTSLCFCGSPCVANGFVYVTAYNFYGDGAIFCFSESNGSLVWQQTIERTDSTPAVYNGKVYVTGGCAGFSPHQTYCFDAVTGAKIWSTATADDIGGWTCSVVVADGKVFVGQESEGGTTFSSFGYHKLFCLDAATGAEVWSYNGCGATVAIYNGIVYSAGDDGRIYAFGTMPPVAGFQVTVPVDSWGYLSSVATFSDTSKQMIPSMTTLHWHWDFGDGTSADYDGTMPAQITHDYANADGWQDQYWTATLTVTNDFGTSTYSEVVHTYAWW
jgi:PKD repeat protein